jgi:hypothetical protein
MTKRKWKLSNPPKESGYYCAHYWEYECITFKRFYNKEDNKWYFNNLLEGPSYFGKNHKDRWSKL